VPAEDIDPALLAAAATAWMAMAMHCATDLREQWQPANSPQGQQQRIAFRARAEVALEPELERLRAAGQSSIAQLFEDSYRLALDGVMARLER
jgi:hypothetical protein